MLKDSELKKCSDPFFRIIENELVIPGVKGTHKFLHVSDVHMSIYDELSDEAEKEKAEGCENSWMKLKEDFTGWMCEPFGEAQKISSREAMEKIFAFAGEESPEALLMSGDMIDFPCGACDRLMEKLLGAYPGEYIYVPGNHDWNFDGKVRKDDVFVHESDGFAVVGVNDCGLTLSDTQLAKLTDIVESGKQIILLMHAPVATDSNREQLKGFGEYFSVDPERDDADENRKKFVKLITDNENVRYILCGHLHGYHVSEFAPGRKQIACSGSNSGFVHRVTVHG